MPFSEEDYDKLIRLCIMLDRDAIVLAPKFLQFRQDAEKGIWKTISSYYPELVPHLDSLAGRINQALDECMEHIMESCFDVLSGVEAEEEQLVVFKQERTDFEAEMAEARAEMHLYGSQAEAFVEDMRQTINSTIASENFTHRCQEIVKKAAYEAFPEIIEFTATSLRMLEYTINLFMSEFNVGFEYVTQGYRYNRFGDGGTVRVEDDRNG